MNNGFNVRRHEPVIVIKVGLSDVGSSSRGNTSDTRIQLFVRCKTIGSGLMFLVVIIFIFIVNIKLNVILGAGVIVCLGSLSCYWIKGSSKP